MASVNKASILGNLGGDPDVRFTPGGQAVANFTVATSESWTDKNTGQKNEKTEWHRVVVWGKLAELCGEYLKKGRKCYLEGRLQTREWQDKDGVKKYTTEIVADQVVFLGGREDGGGQRQQSSQQQGNQQSARDKWGDGEPSQGGGGYGDGYGDIPF